MVIPKLIAGRKGCTFALNLWAEFVSRLALTNLVVCRKILLVVEKLGRVALSIGVAALHVIAQQEFLDLRITISGSRTCMGRLRVLLLPLYFRPWSRMPFGAATNLCKVFCYPCYWVLNVFGQETVSVTAGQESSLRKQPISSDS